MLVRRGCCGSQTRSETRLKRRFANSGNGGSKLPFSSRDPALPKNLYDLQERMVTKFQFEKLIPDNLQQIYSEYVGQLEKDYAELYPLIKELADIEKSGLLEQPYNSNYTVKNFKLGSENFDVQLITRPCLERPGQHVAFTVM